MSEPQSLPTDDLPDVPPDAPRSGALARRWARVVATGEAGMSTAEYAVGTLP